MQSNTVSTSSTHTGYRHIVDNFPLFGFGNPAFACIQTAKELIENSIDACRNQGECSISVTMHFDRAARQLMLKVRDTGCGMDDTLQGLSMFCTSKLSDTTTNKSSASSMSQGGESSDTHEGNISGVGQNQQTGKFGLGLSACLLNSIMKTKSAMRITTKTKTMNVACTTDFSFDYSTGAPFIQGMSAGTLPSTEAGTSSSFTAVTLCLEWIENLNQTREVIEAIREFLLRFSLLPFHSIRTGLNVVVYPAEFSAAIPAQQYTFLPNAPLPSTTQTSASRVTTGTVTAATTTEGPDMARLLQNQDEDNPLAAYLRSVMTESSSQEASNQIEIETDLETTHESAESIAVDTVADADTMMRLASQVKRQCHLVPTGCIVAGANISITNAGAEENHTPAYKHYTIVDCATGTQLKQTHADRRRQLEVGEAAAGPSANIKLFGIFIRSSEDSIVSNDQGQGSSPGSFLEPGPNGCPMSVRVRLLRYINDSPMVDLAQDPSSCGITQAVRTFDFKSVGHKLASVPVLIPAPGLGSTAAVTDTGTPPATREQDEGSGAGENDQEQDQGWYRQYQDAVEHHGNGGNGMDVEVETEMEIDLGTQTDRGVDPRGQGPNPQNWTETAVAGIHCPVEWYLESTYDSTATHFGSTSNDTSFQSSDVSTGGAGGDTAYTLYLVVDYCSTSVPYCNLKKTGIELGAEECRSIHKALAVIMRRISKLARSSRPLTDAGGNIAADHFPYNKFQSKLDYEKGRILTSYIPSVARSMSRIVTALSKGEPGFYDHCCARYGWQRDSPRSVTGPVQTEGDRAMKVGNAVREKLQDILRNNHQISDQEQ